MPENNKEAHIREGILARPIESFYWWKVGVTREVALEGLNQGTNGSFVIRDSSKNGAFVSFQQVLDR
jgi:hypothetical protein